MKVADNKWYCYSACRKFRRVLLPNVFQWQHLAWQVGVPVALRASKHRSALSMYHSLPFNVQAPHNALRYVMFYAVKLQTTWSTVIVDKLIVGQIVKKFPAFHGTRTLTTTFIRTQYWIPLLSPQNPYIFLQNSYTTQILILSHHSCSSRDSVGGIATRLWAARLRNRGSISRTAKRLCSTPNCQDQLYCPPSTLFHRFRVRRWSLSWG